MSDTCTPMIPVGVHVVVTNPQLHRVQWSGRVIGHTTGPCPIRVRHLDGSSDLYSHTELRTV